MVLFIVGHMIAYQSKHPTLMMVELVSSYEFCATVVKIEPN